MAKPSQHADALLTDEEFHSIARALADPRRFAMLQQIAAAPEACSCAHLEEQKVISPATISHHLKELAEAGLISVERQGRVAKLALHRSRLQAYIKRLSSL